MTGTYLSAAALNQSAEVQTSIDTHLMFRAMGYADYAKEAGPCQRRVGPEQLFARYGRLLQRTPGITFADTSRRPGGEWFGKASAQGQTR